MDAAANDKLKLSSSEVSFPRGGGIGLSLLEAKTISNKATEDVLFEQASSKKRSQPRSEQPQKKTKYDHKKRKSKDSKPTEDNERIVDIEHFSFKTLTPGSQVLGQVTYIAKNYITLSLGDYLTGRIPITSISAEVTELLEKYDAAMDSSSDESDDEDTNVIRLRNTKVHPPKLEKLFHVGQWLRAVVIASTEESGKSINLSIEPSLVNASMEEEDLVINNVVQVSVKSVEDHGIVCSLGLGTYGGFLPTQALKKSDLNSRTLAPGLVLLTSIVSKKARTLKLRPTCSESVEKDSPVIKLTSVDAIHPGCIVNALVLEVLPSGVCARVFGLMDGTLTLPHANNYLTKDLKSHYHVATTVPARIIGIVEKDNGKKLILSRAPKIFELKDELEQEAAEAFPSGFVLDDTEVVGFDSEFLYALTGSGIKCLIHKSNLDPEKDLDVHYGAGTRHPARVLGYDIVDNLLILTYDPKVINSKFVSPEQVPIGEYVPSAKILKIIPAGLIVKVFDSFDALVPNKHLSDIKLVHPERKFKVGGKVKGRILNKFGRQLTVTLKKSLVNMDDDAIVHSIDDLKVGFKTTATVEKFVAGGVVVCFFGLLRAYLPKAEISETFVSDPRDYLKEGQPVTVRILTVTPEEGKITVTLRQASELTKGQAQTLDQLTVGRSIVQATITEKTKEAVIVELTDSNLRGVIHTGHLSDGNYPENRVIYKALKIGGIIEALVIDIDQKQRLLIFSAKKSLIAAAKSDTLPLHYEDIHVGALVPGYIKSVTNLGLFVAFSGKLNGLVLPKNASQDPSVDLLKLFYKDQTVTCNVIRTDDDNKRFLLSLNSSEATAMKSQRLKNPCDPSIKLASDLHIGTSTSGIIDSIEDNHLSIRLADNLFGRIHTSQAQELTTLTDKSKPFSKFNVGQKLEAKVIGFHNKIMNKYSGYPSNDTVIELSILKKYLSDSEPYKVSADKIPIGSTQRGVIDGFNHGRAIFTICPGLSGLVPVYNLSASIADFKDFETSFAVGTILDLKAVFYDEKSQKLIFGAEKNTITHESDLKVGEAYPAMVFSVSDSNVLVEFAHGVTGRSYITEALNDYDDKLIETYRKYQCVVATVFFNEDGKVHVSLRDEENAKDKPIVSLDDIRRGSLVKGFVNGINKNGLYVSLGRDFYALVRANNISDSNLGDCKKQFTLFQPVYGKILQCAGEGRILMTLKESEVNGDLSNCKVLEDLEVGEIYEGSIRRVTDYGVFVTLDGTDNVGGLCHKSEISDSHVDNFEELFALGDRVKVKILSISSQKKQLALGMKASYFTDSIEDGASSEEEQPARSDSEDEEMEEAFDNESDSDKEDETSTSKKTKTLNGLGGLSTNGFDWTASILDQAQDDESSDDDEDFTQNKRKKRKVKEQVRDRTQDMNAGSPESIADFERMILGNPDSSVLWMNYMSFQLQLGEIEKSREIAERALRTINYREEQEKLNIWIALLNLENSFGGDESLDHTFKRSVQHMDSLTMHQKLVGIYVLSEKFDKAEALLKVMTKKFSQNIGVWVQSGSYFLEREQTSEAHEVLSRALQSLPKRDHIEVVRKFGQLEFAKGDAEQGRSLFEGLVTDAPKRIDLWNVYIDQEIKQGDRSRVESLFERVLNKKLSKKQAKFFFSKWLSFEEANGNEQTVARVKALAIEFVQNHQKSEE